MTTHGAWTDADRQLSETLIDYWTQFAATGNPNRDGLPEWPQYDSATDRHLDLGETVTVGEDLHHAGGTLFLSFEKSRRAGS